jgi:hypothetical protein
MAWRAMASLLVLRDQVNALAPDRSTASDGLVGDAAHQQTNSDHNPHYVPGVGDNIVTALDLTHDPDHGFDSYRFAEVLRRNRDRRIKYVISNYRIFSSYTSGSRAAWTWGAYSGPDPHTNHVHTSVLDAVISDTKTPWNLEGFDDMAYTEAQMRAFPWAYEDPGQPSAHKIMVDEHGELRTGMRTVADIQADLLNAITALDAMETKLAEMDAKLDQIIAKLGQGGGITFPATSTVSATSTGIITWNPVE